MKFNQDIKTSGTLSASFYTCERTFQHVLSCFEKSWQPIAYDLEQTGNNLIPIQFLPNSLNEPLLLARLEKWRCLSNVCTHRANILVEKPTRKNSISCRYHGRCFELNGRFKSMPEFNEAVNFPSGRDHLPELPLHFWNGLAFTSFAPSQNFDDFLSHIETRVGWLPLDELKHQSALSKTYQVKAHWALYCDNYLEGFHIPYVHPQLNKAIDYSNYSTELFENGVLQIGFAREGEEVLFDLPENHQDFGRKVYAYYFWLFPNLMFNFYPWGLSLNIVEPVSMKDTIVRFETFVFDEAAAEQFMNAGIDQTELEDEHIVENVQKGIESKLYQSGRFSPTMEKGVHHFHLLLENYLKANA